MSVDSIRIYALTDHPLRDAYCLDLIALLQARYPEADISVEIGISTSVIVADTPEEALAVLVLADHYEHADLFQRWNSQPPEMPCERCDLSEYRHIR